MGKLSFSVLLITGATLLIGCSADRPTEPAAEALTPNLHQAEGPDQGNVVRDWAWGNDEMWEWIGPISPLKGVQANETAKVALYFTAPVFDNADLKTRFDDPDLQNPTHLHIGVREHNHVLAVPKNNRGSFTAVMDEVAVVPGPEAVPFGEGMNVGVRCVKVPVPMNVGCPGGKGWIPHLYAADLGRCAAGELTPLTSVERIEEAAAAGLAHLLRISDMDPRINSIPIAVRPMMKSGEGRVVNDAPECMMV